MAYVIIGNAAAAISAVESIRKIDTKKPIILISDEPYHTYSRPLISYYLGDKVTEDTMRYRGENFYKKHNVTTYFGKKVVEIICDKKQVRLEDDTFISYDKLLIATGSKPFVPPMKGLTGKENIHTFLKLEDAVELKQKVKKDMRVVIVGAGLIGLKAAEGLHKLCDDITVVELADSVLSTILDRKAADIVQKHITQEGIKFIFNTTISEIEGETKVEKLTLQDGRVIPCDLLVVAIGVRPNVDIAQTAGIDVNRGIVVDDSMQTNIADIYAAGDVTESLDVASDTRRVLALWPNAYRQGEVAGCSMAGGDAIFDSAFAMNAIGFFGLPMITAGLVNVDETQAEQYEVQLVYDEEEKWIKKFIIKQNQLKGFILISKVDRAGIYTSLIKEGIDIRQLDRALTSDAFGLIAFSKELRAEKMLKGGRI